MTHALPFPRTHYPSASPPRPSPLPPPDRGEQHARLPGRRPRHQAGHQGGGRLPVRRGRLARQHAHPPGRRQEGVRPPGARPRRPGRGQQDRHHLNGEREWRWWGVFVSRGGVERERESVWGVVARKTNKQKKSRLPPARPGPPDTSVRPPARTVNGRAHHDAVVPTHLKKKITHTRPSSLFLTPTLSPENTHSLTAHRRPVPSLPPHRPTRPREEKAHRRVPLPLNW